MEALEDVFSLLEQNLSLIATLRRHLAELPSEVQSTHTAELVQTLSHFHSCLDGCAQPQRLIPGIVTVYFKTTLKLLGQLAKSVQAALRSEKTRENLLVDTAKLNALVAAWQRVAYETPEDDLLALPQHHDRWHRLSEVTEHHRPADTIALRSMIEGWYKTAIYAHAFFSKGLTFTNKTMRKIATGFYAFYYSVNSKKAYHQARVDFANPSLESVLTLARAEDSVALKLMESSPFKVGCNRMVFICRESNRVSLKEESSTIPVRVVCSHALSFTKSVPNTLFSASQVHSDAPRPSKVVLHCHGGAFVSMSSGGHLSYLQKWALDNPGCVIFSVDYRLAPEHPYPAGPDDVWQVYLWLLNHARDEIDIDTSKIVLAGDSAGGHLSIGTVVRAIQGGVRIPDGLLLPYPALCLDPDHFSPSLILSLDDMMMNFTFLKTCLAAYLQDQSLDPNTDPVLSPIYAQRDLLEKFPPTRILVGTLDPLMDDCFRFAEKLLDAHVDIRMAVFEGIIHGGMNHMIKTDNEDVKALTLRASAYLTELFAS